MNTKVAKFGLVDNPRTQMRECYRDGKLILALAFDLCGRADPMNLGSYAECEPEPGRIRGMAEAIPDELNVSTS